MPFPLRRILRHPVGNASRLLFRNTIMVRPARPIISFTFDDCPRTALLTGGSILQEFGAAGTYYVSMGLLGQESPSGELMGEADLRFALEQGHELGCHTFLHLHSARSEASAYRESVLRNREALSRLIPAAKFRSFSYPINEPKPANKRAVAGEFLCCRAGGQTFNAGRTDLNQLSAFFLEMARGDIGMVKNLVDRSTAQRGWIIFATHDIAPQPSPYGCTPEFFRAAVRCAAESGAEILPVVKALESLRQSAGAPVFKAAARAVSG